VFDIPTWNEEDKIDNLWDPYNKLERSPQNKDFEGRGTVMSHLDYDNKSM